VVLKPTDRACMSRGATAYKSRIAIGGLEGAHPALIEASSQESHKRTVVYPRLSEEILEDYLALFEVFVVSTVS